jgi:hypothetical protein
MVDLAARMAVAQKEGSKKVGTLGTLGTLQIGKLLVTKNLPF